MNKPFLTTAFLILFSAFAAQTSYTFSGKPVYEIEARRNNISLGVIEVELFPTVAPLHVRNFDSLVSVQFYDTTAFHRVIPGFMIQGGDPNSRSGPTSTWGYGDPSQPTVPAEFSTLKHVRGILSAARKGGDINSATSQFFICVATASSLDGQYSIYGRVLSGMAVVDTIVSAPRNTINNMPYQKIEMFVTKTYSDDALPGTPVITNPAYGAREIGVSVPLKWQSVAGTLLYNVEISTDSTFATKLDSVTLTGLQYTKTQLQDSTIYYWRVRANNGGNFSAFSYGKFSTVGETTRLAMINAMSGHHVFPNPGTGIFSFSGLRPGTVIELSDVSGRLIKKVADAGKSNTQVDLRAHGQGLYFYKLSVNNTTTGSGKLIVR